MKLGIGETMDALASTVATRNGVEIRHLLAAGPERVLEKIARDDPAALERIPEDDLDHIVDWLISSALREEDWLGRTDVRGRPLKLMKCGSISRLKHEADKAMRRWNSASPAPSGEGEETEMELADGFRLVRLVTPEALDAESALMGHCVGNGSYDHPLRRGEIAIYSLRDGKGRSHVTIEENAFTGDLVQVHGKQNRPPLERYVELLVPWLNERHRQACLRRVPGQLRHPNLERLPQRFARDRTGVIVDLLELAPGDRFDGDLMFRVFDDGPVFALPMAEGVTVDGAICVLAHRRRGDGGMRATGDLQPVHCPVARPEEGGNPMELRFPRRLSVRGMVTVKGFRTHLDVEADTIHLEHCVLTSLPEEIGTEVVMEQCRIETPTAGDVSCRKGMVMCGCGTVEIGGRMSVAGSLVFMGGRYYGGERDMLAIGGGLDVALDAKLSDCKADIRGLTKAGGRLSLDSMQIAGFGDHVDVGGNLTLFNLTVERMPGSLSVAGDAEVRQCDIDRWPDGIDVAGDLRTEAVRPVAATAHARRL